MQNFANVGTKDVFMGVDEAGRGPVLGPMVYACFYCTGEGVKRLKRLQVDDSKKLTEFLRERFFEQFAKDKDSFGWLITPLMADEISGKMLRKKKYNLNNISHDTAISMIQKVLKTGIKLKHVYVDTVGTPAVYQSKLEQRFPGIAFTVTTKADSKFAVVSAASICAKVTRDNILRNWQYSERSLFPDAGSGYPGDPVTRNYLNAVFDPIFGFPSLVRFSWSTADSIIEKSGVKFNWYEEEDDGENGPAIGNYTAKAPHPRKLVKSRVPTAAYHSAHRSSQICIVQDM